VADVCNKNCIRSNVEKFKFFVNVAYQPKCFVYCFTVGSNDALVTLFRSAMYRDFKNIAFKQCSEASNIDIQQLVLVAVIPTVDIR
jgi:hypothetical protein